MELDLGDGAGDDDVLGGIAQPTASVLSARSANFLSRQESARAWNASWLIGIPSVGSCSAAPHACPGVIDLGNAWYRRR